MPSSFLRKLRQSFEDMMIDLACNIRMGIADNFGLAFGSDVEGPTMNRLQIVKDKIILTLYCDPSLFKRNLYEFITYLPTWDTEVQSTTSAAELFEWLFNNWGHKVAVSFERAATSHPSIRVELTYKATEEN